MKNNGKKKWRGKPKEKGQQFQAKVKVKKVITGESGIPSVIEINGEEYVWRPQRPYRLGKRKEDEVSSRYGKKGKNSCDC